MADTVLPISVGILTVSDTCFAGLKVDASGPHMVKLLTCEGTNFRICSIRKTCVPDEKNKIKDVLLQWCDIIKLDLIITVGGTGFSSKDITPEVTKLVVHREMEHLASAMVLGSLKKTIFSILSRCTCGIRYKTLIINLPGSVKASQECFEEIIPAIKCVITNLKDVQEIADDSIHQKILKNMAFNDDTDQLKSKVDISRVAERPRQSGYSMVSVRNALDLILLHSDTFNVKQKFFRECINHYLAENIISMEPFPLFPASIKDGYAVIAEDMSDVKNVIGNCTPGYLPSCLVSHGNCMRISTGSAIPNGANAVIQVEDTIVVKKDKEGKEEIKIKILKQPIEGQDIRPIGSDIAGGEILVAINKKISAADIGIMSMMGIQSALVYEKPWVAVLSTGNELVQPESVPQPGCIRDSNKNSILHILSQCCIPCLDLGIAKDMPDFVKSHLKLAFETADVVVSTGGVSMGEKDCLKEVLKVDFGADIHFGRVHMKPGKPTTFSTVNFNGRKKFVFCLPGNPVSAFVTFHLFVMPCLRKLMGCTSPENRIIKAKMNHDLELDERPEFHRVSVSYCNDTLTYIVHSTGNQISSRLPSMVWADAVLVLPPRNEEQTKITKGSTVDALLLEKN